MESSFFKSAFTWETRKMNGVNSGKPKLVKTNMAILIQASSALDEGAETSGEVKPS
jgi:hypothetical protein